MYGDGTKANPYVPENWEEFLTAAYTSSTYVSLPDNTVYDFNEIYPAGLNRQINTKCYQINGNGSEIKNILVPNSSSIASAFFFDNINSINDLGFVNIEHSKKDKPFFYFDAVNAKFKNCKFSGVVSDGLMFSAYSSWTIYCDANENGGCSLNMRFLNNGALRNQYNAVYFTFANMKLETLNSTSDNITKMLNLNKCYLKGKWNGGKDLYVSATSSVIDIEIPEGTALRGSASGTVVNTDKIMGTWILGANGIGVTESQLTDAAYLRSVGFDI